MWWRRNQRDSRYRVTSACNDFIDLETRQLTTLARLGTLSNLDLNFVGINEILGSYTKTTRSHLLDCASCACAILARCKTSGILAAFTGITASTNFVHSNGNRFMRFLTDRTKRHCSCNKSFCNSFYRFYFIDTNRCTLLEFQEITNKHRHSFVVDSCSVLFKFLVATQAGCKLESYNRLRIPSVVFAVFAIGIESIMN